MTNDLQLISINQESKDKKVTTVNLVFELKERLFTCKANTINTYCLGKIKMFLN